jgi:beta-aspartyl-peptidase (threonine type)
MQSDLSLIRVAIHGGAGEFPSGRDTAAHRAALHEIATAARERLRQGAAALDVVEAAVAALEDCPLFNAGTGAVLNADGLPELDAAIMDGRDRRCGGIIAVSRLRNPVRVARAVMESSPHVLLAGIGAERFAQAQGFAEIDPATLITTERREQLEAARRTGTIALDHDRSQGGTSAEAGFGTVGAVARDARGHLAAATSTGGLTNKLAGRVGDAPVIGAGTYADDRSVAVSCTGTGEAFIRAVFAHSVHVQVLRGDTDLKTACANVLDDLRQLGGRGGCIAVDRHGRVALLFNSAAMFRAWSDDHGDILIAVHHGE